MNEQIKELARQANVHVITTKGIPGITDGCYIISPRKLEIFAELIVRECAEVASDYDGAHYVGTAIKEHFGVEE